MLPLLIAFIILILMGIITFGEIKSKKSSDLFTNVAISAIVVIVCGYNFITSKFDLTDPVTYIYLIVLVLAGIDAFFYIHHNKKYGKTAITSEKKSNTDLQDAKNEEVEEIKIAENDELK